MNHQARFEKLSQVAVGLTTNFDNASATKQLTMSDERDFLRPLPQVYDSNLVDDKQQSSKDNFVEQVQKFLKNKPLGISYDGEVTGKITQSLLHALIDFEVKLQNQFPSQNIIGTIVNGNSISQSGFISALKLIAGQKKNTTSPIAATTTDVSIPETSSSSIKEFQSYFGLTPTGIPDEQLITAAKTIENKIAETTKNSGAHGLLWDDTNKKFRTTVADLQNALIQLDKLKNN